ncbi:MAG: hypothetical protein LCI00_16755 [Chloroflexi bacterium]|nr:hypothetical protein [Chloroflexota bacterium]
MTPQNDPIATAQALADHGEPAYRRMLASEQARAAGGNKSEAASAVKAVYEQTRALSVRGVDTDATEVWDIVEGME